MPGNNTCMGIYQFDEESQKIFKEIIKPHVETHVGLSFVDAAQYYESSSIKMDLIQRMISEANLVISDITYENANVFMELGIAYSLGKRVVIICKKSAWDGKQRKKLNKKHAKQASWGGKPPFDIGGREVVIFDNDNELKIKLSSFLLDALFQTSHPTLSWSASIIQQDDETFLPQNAHIKSSSELTFKYKGEAWNALGIENRFHVEYSVEIDKENYGGNEPDVRFLISAEKEGAPRIEVIFPWELKGGGSGYECHITYHYSYPETTKNHIRLQEVPVADNIDHKRFNVSISFCWPNLVVESDAFKNGVDRLCIGLEQLKELGYPTHMKQFIGLSVKNCNATIKNIRVKEAC